jgi:hypothetical protein
MNIALRDCLQTELASRGFSSQGEAPNHTMALGDAYLDDTELCELLEVMVARREKVIRSQSVVGADAAKQSYDDVVLVIDAIKAVMKKLTLE